MKLKVRIGSEHDTADQREQEDKQEQAECACFGWGEFEGHGS